MKDKTISLYTFGFRTGYYLSHPWRWLHDLKIAISNAWHRMRCGYAWVDLWNMDHYIAKLIANMLEKLADNSCGWPGEEYGYNSFEEWQNELRILTHLIRIANLDPLIETDKFQNEFNKWRDGTLLEPIKNSVFYSDYEYTAEMHDAIYSATSHHMFLQREYDALSSVIFKALMRLWPSLWD